MPDDNLIVGHYTHGALLEAIQQGIRALGKTEADVTIEDLGPVEEFHIGGRQASTDFLDQLNLRPDDLVLDVGSGLGGVARFAAAKYGCRVTGIDLTREYVQVGQVMNEWVGLQDQIVLEQGSATSMTFADATFDGAYMMHVGMNIADKSSLMGEVYRVLTPGGQFGIYDIMRLSEDDIIYPVPWASDPSGSAVGTVKEYKQALEAAGFQISAVRDRHQFAIDFFDKLIASAAAAHGPPPLGLHLVMGANASEKFANMVENVREARVSPIEIVATKVT